MESNHTKKQSHGSSKSKGSSKDGNRSNNHLQANFRRESGGVNTELTNEKKILFQIGGIGSYEVYNDRSKADKETIDGMQISMASTSPSLSSLSSTSSDYMMELKAKEESKSHISYEHNKENRNISSGLSELQGPQDSKIPISQVSIVTKASIGHPSLSPTQSPPVQVMDREGYDPQRIPSSIFEKSGGLEWSVASNDSLFSLSIGDFSLARDHGISLVTDHAFHYNEFKTEDLMKSGEFLTYCPSLPIHLEDSEGKTSDGEEQRSGETETTMEETDCEEKSSVPILSWRDLSEFNNSDQTLSGSVNSDQIPISLQSFSPPITKKSKKKNKTTTKKKKKKCSLCCCFSCGNICCKWPKWSCCECFQCHHCWRLPKCTCCRCCCCCCYFSS